MGQFSRIMECAGCGVTVEDFGTWRVDFKTGRAHTCYQPVDALDDLTAQALAGGADMDKRVVEAACVWLSEAR